MADEEFDERHEPVLDGSYPGLEDHGPMEADNDDKAADPDLPEDDVATDDIDVEVDEFTEVEGGSTDGS